MDRLTYRDSTIWSHAERDCRVFKDTDEYGNKCFSGAVIDKLAEYEDAEEQGLLVKLLCKVGDTVYVLTECENIQTQLDGTLYDTNGGPGTATGYYCPYEDACPYMDSELSCDECKGLTAVFEDEVSMIWIDETGDIAVSVKNCSIGGIIGGGCIFLTREEAEQALKGGASK